MIHICVKLSAVVVHYPPGSAPRNKQQQRSSGNKQQRQQQQADRRADGRTNLAETDGRTSLAEPSLDRGKRSQATPHIESHHVMACRHSFWSHPLAQRISEQIKIKIKTKRTCKPPAAFGPEQQIKNTLTKMTEATSLDDGHHGTNVRRCI